MYTQTHTSNEKRKDNEGFSPLRQTLVQHVESDVHLDSRHVWSAEVWWEKQARATGIHQNNRDGQVLKTSYDSSINSIHESNWLVAEKQDVASPQRGEPSPDIRGGARNGRGDTNSQRRSPESSQWMSKTTYDGELTARQQLLCQTQQWKALTT